MSSENESADKLITLEDCTAAPMTEMFIAVSTIFYLFL